MRRHQRSNYSFWRRSPDPSNLRRRVWTDKAGREHQPRCGRPHPHPAQQPGYQQPSQQLLRRARQAERERIARRIPINKLRRVAQEA